MEELSKTIIQDKFKWLKILYIIINVLTILFLLTNSINFLYSWIEFGFNTDGFKLSTFIIFLCLWFIIFIYYLLIMIVFLNLTNGSLEEMSDLGDYDHYEKLWFSRCCNYPNTLFMYFLVFIYAIIQSLMSIFGLNLIINFIIVHYKTDLRIFIFLSIDLIKSISYFVAPYNLIFLILISISDSINNRIVVVSYRNVIAFMFIVYVIIINLIGLKFRKLELFEIHTKIDLNQIHSEDNKEQEIVSTI